MKNKLIIFGVCQLFFMALFAAIAIDLDVYEGLSPVDWRNETVEVDLKENVSFDKIKEITKANK